MTNYPSAIDTNNSLPLVTDLVSPIRAQDHNNLQGAIVSVESELGVNPSGTFGTVSDRIDDIDGYLTSVVDKIFSPAVLGDAEDGSYTDGLFIDLTPTTTLGVFADRVNEVLGGISPPPAPALSDFSFTSSLGVAGHMSFGTSNVVVGYTNVGTNGGGSALDINGLFTSGSGASLRKGVFNASSNMSGVLADAIAAGPGLPTAAYPANAFADGYSGTLDLEVNGTIVHSVDLTSFSSGSSLNGNGSGFQSLSPATSVSFTNGEPFSLFSYRTGNWVVDSADHQNGYNYSRVVHRNGASFTRATNFFEWVVDADITATSYSLEVLDALAMTGSLNLSGVEYHTGGTAQYDVTVSNIHRNTYSDSASAISHPTSTNCTISSTALGIISAESDTEVITNQVVTVSPDSGSRILDGSITVNTSGDRVVQTDNASGGQSIAGLLVDGNTDTSTATNENLSGEDYRVPSNRSLTDTTGFTSGGAGLWDSTISLISVTAGYLDGAIVSGGSIYYPNNASVANSGNFSGITNGPAGNVNYTTASGARVYWRYFYFSSSTSNFVFNLNGSGTVVNAGTVSGSTDEFSIEFLLPNTSQDGVGTVEFKDGNIAYTSENNAGCFASTFGNNQGNTAGADIGISFGSRNTSTSGNAVILRIVVGSGWTGNVSNLQLVGA